MQLSYSSACMALFFLIFKCTLWNVVVILSRFIGYSQFYIRLFLKLCIHNGVYIYLALDVVIFKTECILV